MWYRLSKGISWLILCLVLPVKADLLEAYTDETNPLAGKVWDTQERRFIEIEVLLQQATDGSWLLLGETHDNTDHHNLQTDIINYLASNQKLANVAFEMAHSEQQVLLDEASRGEIELTPDALNWQQGWPWEWYEGPVSAAIKNAKRVVAADLTRDQKMQAYQNDELEIPASADYREFMLDLLFDSHCAKMPRSQLGNMLRVQYSRDRSMTDSLIANTSQSGINLLIAGSVHTRKDLGLPYWQPDLPSKTILLVAANDSTNPDDYYPPSYTNAPVAEYILFTPRFDYQGGCD